MKSILFLSHGSRSKESRKEIDHLVDQLKEKYPDRIVQAGFLEIEDPNIPTAISKCVKSGASEIIVLLHFLNSGRHVSLDIPAIINQAKSDYPSIIFRATPCIGQHPSLLECYGELIG